MRTPRRPAWLAVTATIGLIAIVAVSKGTGPAEAQIGDGTTTYQQTASNVSLPANFATACASIGVPSGKILTIRSLTAQVTPVSASGANPGIQLRVMKTAPTTSEGLFVPIPLSQQGTLRAGSVETLVHLGAGVPSGVDFGTFTGALCLRRNGATGVFAMSYVVSGYLEPAGEVPPS